MSDFRSKAEEFVTEFLDYINKYDILDELDKRTQKMVRSAGVETLYQKAIQVFPARKPEGASASEMRNLSDADRDEAIADAPNVVVDTRKTFSRMIQENGGTRRLLRQVLEGDKEALQRAQEFFLAEDGKKEFADV